MAPSDPSHLSCWTAEAGRPARRAALAIGALALALVVASSAHAEPESAAANSVPSPETEVPIDETEGDGAESPSISHSETVVVKGSEGDGAAGPVFAPTTIETQVIDAETIRNTPSLSVDHVVKNYPGIRVQQRIQGEQAAVSIEGLPPEYTQILVNGQRYTGRIDEVDDLNDVPLTNVERIEILRGAQGVRHGSDAAGGVINILTRRPPESGVRVDLDGGYGTDRRTLGAGTVATRLGDVGVSLSATHSAIAGYDRRDVDQGIWVSIGDSGSRFATNDVYGTLDYTVGEAADVWLRGGYRQEKNDYEREGESVGSLDFARGLATAGVDWQISPAADLISELTFFDGGTENDIVRDFTLDENLIRANGSAVTYFDVGPVYQRTILGYDVRHSTLDLQEGGLPFEPGGGIDPISFDREASEAQTLSSIFLQSESSLFSDRLTLLLGVRAQLHSRFDDKLLPQVAVVGDPLETLRLRLQWSMAYRTPSLRDLFQPDTPQLNYWLGGNPDLQPESSRSLRFGFDWTPRPWISLASVAYRNEIDDFIRALRAGGIQTGINEVVREGGQFSFCDDFPDHPLCQPSIVLTPVVEDVFRPMNIDSVLIYGVETQLLLKPHHRVDLRAGYTWQRNRAESDALDLTEVPNEPRHVVNLAGVVRIPSPVEWLGDPRIGATAEYRGKALVELSGTGQGTFATTDYSDPSWIVDARLALPISWGIEFYFDAFNVTNTVIVDSYEVRGRTFFGGIKFTNQWGDS